MNIHGIEVTIKNTPLLDKEFTPIYSFNKAFLSGAKKPVYIAIERDQKQIARIDTFIHGTPDFKEADEFYINRLVKTLLWMKGGYRILVHGDSNIFSYLKQSFCKGGSQDFDAGFMGDVFEHEFTVEEVSSLSDFPSEYSIPKKVGGNMSGCRIGFDAGGSDRKVSAIIDGKSVYDEEVVWFPKTNSDPDYHYDGIVSALKSAAKHLPGVDCVGVSSAGIFINNRTMKASLFLKVSPEDFDKKVKDIYIRAIRDTFGDIPFEVVNDGDVSALAGTISLEKNNVLGIAMGTSEAAGFVDDEGRITGWLNELAFVPVDASLKGAFDEWSLDIGCGVKYFSQDSVIKLMPAAGIKEASKDLSPAEKLKVVQALMEKEDEGARNIYLTLGCYLGHTMAWYYQLYNCSHVLLLGRVMSGKGGDIILSEANRVLLDEYPDVAKALTLSLPDEKFRRVGQSAAAASLPG